MLYSFPNIPKDYFSKADKFRAQNYLQAIQTVQFGHLSRWHLFFLLELVTNHARAS